jgi:hypothetical protein
VEGWCVNYGFVPGGTNFDKIARDYLRWRSSSQVLTTGDVTVESFVKALGTSTSVQRPVETLGIGCHGHRYGALEIKLDANAPKIGFYDDVDKVATSGTIKIANAVIFPRPVVNGMPVTPTFRIVGCSIGAAQPYLKRLKEALGPVFVRGTPHEDGQVKLTINGTTGVLRMLEYDFIVTDPITLEGPLDVIEAFHSKQLTWFDGTSIPKDFWKPHIPTDVFATTKTRSGINVDFSPKLNGVSTLQLDLDIWEHVWEPIGPYPVTPPSSNLPSTTQRRDFVRNAIKSRPEFAAGHAFPLHKQRGYPSYDAFIDGYDWLPSRKSDALWTGYRNLYRVQVPVTDPPGSSKVIYDWVEASGTSNHIGLDEVDARLFTTAV